MLALAIFAAGALGGALPLWGRAAAASADSRWLGWGNAFAAGAFLGAGLIHLLPDSSQTFTAIGVEYPMAFLLAAVAFVLMLLFEHVLLPDSAHRVVHAPSNERFAHLDEHGAQGIEAYAVLVALSVHSFLAGLALGAEAETAAALVVFFAIAAHKSIGGFALGVSLVRNRMPQRRAWSLLFIFVIATPLGIAAGMVLGHALDGRAGELAEATLLALAAGTFAYVATLDILRDEFTEGAGRFSKWWMVSAGVGLMAWLALYV